MTAEIEYGEPQVVIAGAGPVGLTLACCLRLHGIPLRIVDAGDGKIGGSRALALHPRQVEVLDRLGALGDLQSRAQEMLAVAVHVGGKYLATFRFGGPVLGGPSSLQGIPQGEIESELRSRLAELGTEVEWNCAVVDVSQDAESVTTILSTGERIQSPWLAGCDGSHSVVRKAVGIDFLGRPVAQRFVLADVRADWVHRHERDKSFAWFAGNGVLFGISLPDSSEQQDLWRFLGTFPLSEAEELDERGVVDHIRRMLRERALIDGIEIREVLWTSTFRIQERLAQTYRKGRVFLAGDAAHIHSPIGGQGMNQGIGDAENLSWKLALVIEGLADGALLDTYEAERLPFARRIASGTTRATKLILTDGRLRTLLRDRMIIPLSNLPIVHRKLTEAASQLRLTYRGGPLAAMPSRFARGVQPGDRIADQPCLRDGAKTRLYDELGGRWVLLVPSIPSPAAAAAAAVLQHEIIVLRAADRRRDALLIRPDAHLAWRGPADAVDVGEWLRRTLRGASGLSVAA